MKHRISLYGAPQTIRSDQGLEFCNNSIIFMMTLLNVKIKVKLCRKISQNFVDTFENKKCDGVNDWEKSLPTLILAYNAT